MDPPDAGRSIHITVLQDRRRLRELEADALPIHLHLFVPQELHGELRRAVAIVVDASSRPDLIAVLRPLVRARGGYRVVLNLTVVHDGPVTHLALGLKPVTPGAAMVRVMLRSDREDHREIMDNLDRWGYIAVFAEQPGDETATRAEAYFTGDIPPGLIGGVLGGATQAEMQRLADDYHRAHNLDPIPPAPP